MNETRSELLPAREGYRLWATTYETETAVSLLENRLVLELSPPLAGARLLDAACGTARRLRSARGTLRRVGVDLVPEMLEIGRRAARTEAAMDERRAMLERPHRRSCEPSMLLAAADLRSLPLPSGAFDLVWCRLALGHLASADQAYRELARVCRPGGALVVTDFHPAAARAGHRRTFRGPDGQVRELEHHIHDGTDHVAAALLAGLDLVSAREMPVGAEIRTFYERAGRLDLYDAQRDLPLVLGLLFQRADT